MPQAFDMTPPARDSPFLFYIIKNLDMGIPSLGLLTNNYSFYFLAF